MEVKVIDPSGKEYISYPFDGSKHSNIRHYFTPEVKPDQCGTELSVGTWTVVFEGASFSSYKFEIIDEVIVGDEDKYLLGCLSNQHN